MHGELGEKQGDRTLTQTVFTHKVEDVAKWKGFDDERARNMGAFGTDIQSFIDPSGGNMVAVTMNVTDPEGLRVFMKSETSGSIARKHGVIPPINVMTDGK